MKIFRAILKVIGILMFLVPLMALVMIGVHYAGVRTTLLFGGIGILALSYLFLAMYLSTLEISPNKDDIWLNKNFDNIYSQINQVYERLDMMDRIDVSNTKDIASLQNDIKQLTIKKEAVRIGGLVGPFGAISDGDILAGKVLRINKNSISVNISENKVNCKMSEYISKKPSKGDTVTVKFNSVNPIDATIINVSNS